MHYKLRVSSFVKYYKGFIVITFSIMGAKEPGGIVIWGDKF